MKLYVIRHGLTNANNAGIYNGSLCDEDINELGISQAKESGKLLDKDNIDLVISSPMKRTRHSLELLGLKSPVIYDARLVDRCFGNLTLKPVNDKLCSGDKSVETREEVFKRVEECLKDIKEKYYDKNILIVTHGAVTLAISNYFGIIESQQNNCEIREYNW